MDSHSLCMCRRNKQSEKENYSNALVGFRKYRAFEWITKTFPVMVVKIKNTQNLGRDLFKAVVTNASEESILWRQIIP